MAEINAQAIEDRQDIPPQDVPVATEDTTTTEPTDKTPEPAAPIDAEQMRAQIREELESTMQERIDKQNEELKSRLSKVFGDDEEVEEDGPPTQSENESLTQYLDRYTEWKDQQKEKQSEVKRQREIEEQETRAKQANDYIENVKSGWAEQMKEMEEDGILSPVTDENNPEDPGAKQRLALFTKMNEINADRTAKGLASTYNLHEVYHRFYKPTADVPGADAPILGGSVKADGGSDELYYEDLHNKDFYDIASGGK